MRPYPMMLLVRILLLFFTRRVLSLGVLRSAAVRWLAAGGCAALTATCAVAAYRFLDMAAQGSGVWTLLFRLVTVSVVVWVQVAFILVKVLFLNAEGMLQVSFQLPLTNRERAGALLAYESVIVAIVTGAGTGAVCLAATLRIGLRAVPLVVESVFLPAALTYLVLSAVHLAACRLMRLLRAPRAAAVAAVVVQFGIVLAYARHIPELTSDISANYLLSEDHFVWVGLLADVRDRHGWTVMFLAALGVMAVLIAACVALSPREHVAQSRYFRTPARARGGLGLAYDLCLVRSSQTMLTSAVAIAALASLCLHPVVNPLWGLSLSSMAGLYHFAATDPLRAVGLDRAAPWVVYGRLVRGQVLLVIALGAPSLVVVDVVTTQAFSASMQALAGSAAGVLLSTTIGILFPAEHDNPFSVFIGLSLTAVVLGIAGLGIGILQLPALGVQACVLGVLAVSVAYGVIGVRLSEQRRRYEEVAASRQQHRGRRPADARRRRGDAALPHVLRG